MDIDQRPISMIATSPSSQLESYKLVDNIHQQKCCNEDTVLELSSNQNQKDATAICNKNMRIGSGEKRGGGAK